MPDNSLSIQEVETITANDVARLNVAQQVTPPPPDERTDREKEIDGRLTVLEAEIDERRTEQKSLVAERDQISTKRSAAKKIAAMSPAERAALGIPEPQVIADAGGIKSVEAVGDIGGGQ